MIYILIIILGLISGYRECQILVETGRWNIPGYLWIPFWDTTFKIFGITVKIDSFHFMVGLFTLLMSYIMIYHSVPIYWDKIIFIPIYWSIYFYSRNQMMHIIAPVWTYKRWWFIVPIIGGALDERLRK